MQTVLGPDGLQTTTVGVVGNNPLLRWLGLSGSLEYNAQRKTIKPFQAAAPFEDLADPGNVPPTGAGAGAPGAPRADAGAGAGARAPAGTRAGRGSYAETGAPRRPQVQVLPTTESRPDPARPALDTLLTPTATTRRMSDRKPNPLPAPVLPEAFSKYQLNLITTMITEHCKGVTSAFALQFKTQQKQISTLHTHNSDQKTDITALKKSNTSLKSKVAALEAAPQPQTVSSTPRPCEYL